MDLSKRPVLSYSKETQTRGSNAVKKEKRVRHQRGKPRLRDRGRVTPEVYAAAYEDAGGRCERCKWKDGSYTAEGRKWRLEAAHAVRRRHLEQTTADDIIMLCGPVTDSATCHHFADYTREGRQWMLDHQKARRKIKTKEQSNDRT